MADDIQHTIGRFYRCPQSHEFDRVGGQMPLDRNHDPRLGDPFTPMASCPTCGESAPVQYITAGHKPNAKCPFGQCAITAP